MRQIIKTALRRRVGFTFGLASGLSLYCILYIWGLMTRNDILSLLAILVSPFIAGIFSDDESWFYTGFFTLFVPSVITGLIMFPLGSRYLFPTVFVVFSTGLILPIFSVITGVVGGLISMLGRMVGEEIFELIK
ncbi:MAG: hypothetical protein ACTSX9_08330 [Candidatus Njordarchaeales archaeon]